MKFLKKLLLATAIFSAGQVLSACKQNTLVAPSKPSSSPASPSETSEVKNSNSPAVPTPKPTNYCDEIITEVREYQDPLWSEDGSTLLYTQRNHQYAENASNFCGDGAGYGTNSFYLFNLASEKHTFLDKNIIHPVWSHLSPQLFFQTKPETLIFSSEQPKPKMMVSDSNGTNIEQISTAEYSDGFLPTWSEDGKGLFTNNKDHSGVFLFSLDKRNYTQIGSYTFRPLASHSKLKSQWLERQQAMLISEIVENRDWSDKETKIGVYVRLFSSKSNTLIDIFSPDSDSYPGVAISEITLSPDKRQAVFSILEPKRKNTSEHRREHIQAKIYLLNLDSGVYELLTESQTHQSRHAWSPDGKSISFSDLTASASHEEVYELKLDSKKRVQLTHHDDTKPQTHNYRGTWSADGKYMAFVSNQDDLSGDTLDKDGIDNIYLMDLKAQVTKRLTFGSSSSAKGP